MSLQQAIGLTKEGRRHIILYPAGEEMATLRLITKWLNRGDIYWHEAAILSHQVGQKLAAAIKEFKIITKEGA